MSSTPAILLAKALALSSALVFSGGLVFSGAESADDRAPGDSKSVVAERSGRTDFINSCVIDFNDPVVISTLPDQAANTFVGWPYWAQSCALSDVGVYVEPIGYDHYHLNYAEAGELCPELGVLGHRDSDGVCHPIDPVTEPRSGVQPHTQNFGIRVYAYNWVTRERVTFDLNELRIMGGDAEVCFERTDKPWISAGPIDGPAGYCGIVEPGSWDVSASVTDVYEVRIWSRAPTMSFTDLGIGIY